MTGRTENLSGKIVNNELIIDSEASHHMTGCLDLLFNIQYIVPVAIELPLDIQAFAVKQGSMRLSDNKFLSNVLFVPKMLCTLISIKCLMKDLNFLSLLLMENVLQDRVTRTMIGTCEEHDGVFLFRKVEQGYANRAKVDDNFKLWHRRLRHTSKTKLILIPEVKSSIRTFEKPCDVCFKAKQTREVFLSSDNKVKYCFELIHYDLWGPYRTPASCGSHYFLTIIVDDFSRAMWIYLLADKREVEKLMHNFFAMMKRQFGKQVKIVRSDNGTKTPTKLLNWKSPYELLFHKPPPYKQLRDSGCLCYAHRQVRDKDKFGERSRKCIFVGYPYGKKGWRVYDIENDEYFISRDVVFYEGTFPYADPSNQAANGISRQDDSDPYGTSHVSEDIFIVVIPEITSSSSQNVRDTKSDSIETNTTNETNIVELVEEPQVNSTDGIVGTLANINDQEPVNDDRMDVQAYGRGKRTSQPSILLKNFVTYSACCSKDPVPINPVQFKSLGTRDPIVNYLNCANLNFSVKYRTFLAAVTNSTEPTRYAQVVKENKWCDAMKKEIDALESNGTWELTTLPPRKKAIDCKWVYKTKYNNDGTVERHKARLMIYENRHQEGADYKETFVPVAKMVTVRTFLSVAASKKWELHQMDVYNAFLHGELNEEVYMRLPPGFVARGKHTVCRLKKSLYGLKQAPLCWFAKLVRALKDFDFVQSLYDYSLFTYIRDEVRVHVLVYVDDLIVGGNNLEKIKEFKAYLSECFHMKDLGALRYFLGLEIAQSKDGIYLCQSKLLGCKPMSFPMDENHKLALATGPLLKDPKKYRRLVGKLIYLTISRPELSYCVHILAQFMQNPLVVHWEAALRVVRYLKGNLSQGVMLSSNNDLYVSAYCDFDWARIEERKDKIEEEEKKEDREEEKKMKKRRKKRRKTERRRKKKRRRERKERKRQKRKKERRGRRRRRRRKKEERDRKKERKKERAKKRKKQDRRRKKKKIEKKKRKLDRKERRKKKKNKNIEEERGKRVEDKEEVEKKKKRRGEEKDREEKKLEENERRRRRMKAEEEKDRGRRKEEARR
ncbi:retrovirus-related pol polyprotein from transposon TNT 1-94 [Tanacetum coccineum]|uniref:Retrovirus-related pol polyprotein from transposon TNT 1-94 n=1 Tax=Tanacetum coccineum TaxID=301880 RepID=A0ABQ5AL25_9ASTR